MLNFHKMIKYDPIYLGTAVGTWLVVIVISLISPSATDDNSVQLLCGHLLMLLAILISINEVAYPGGYYPRYLALATEYLATLWLWTLQPDSFLAIYSIILVAQLNFFFSKRFCLGFIIASMGGFYLLQSLYWQYPHALRETLLFSAFHIFAWLTASRAATEQAAKEQALQAHKALEANSLLLADSSKQSERLRIARELHDAIGHQLTALSIKLEVASLAACDNFQARSEIQQCRELTGQLLADIRQVVSDYRDDSDLNFNAALTLMLEGIPKLDIEVVNGLQSISRADIASALLRTIQEAITNSLRHSSTNKLRLVFSSDAQGLHLSIQDFGLLLKPITPGNGLNGMRERIEALGGELRVIGRTGSGLELKIDIPVADSSRGHGIKKL